jgi:hypothetical protein
VRFQVGRRQLHARGRRALVSLGLALVALSACAGAAPPGEPTTGAATAPAAPTSTIAPPAVAAGPTAVVAGLAAAATTSDAAPPTSPAAPTAPSTAAPTAPVAGGPASPTAAPTGQAGGTPGAAGPQRRQIDDLVATVTVDPGVLRPATVEVRLTDPTGRPVTDARRVDVSVGMRAMNHGVRGATATQTGPGVYTATARILVMAGPSLLVLRVERADGRRQSALFELDVPPDRSGAATGLLADRPTDPVQVVDVQVDPSGVVPDRVTVRAGRPVRLQVIYVERPACGDAVQVGEAGARAAVSAEGLAELTFTTERAGELRLACGPGGLRVG